MANLEHLAILKQGVEQWNKWRDEHREVRPDLSEADLSEADLSSAYLSEASLSGANLSLANLSGADLSEADLSGADLSEADLSGANLSSADLIWADLTEASLERTNFADVDLSVATGLETIEHHGPSTIGIDTIYRSKGKIPEVFLRGCGVPEEAILFARSVARNPIEFYSCFISYAHEDKPFARRQHTPRILVPESFSPKRGWWRQLPFHDRPSASLVYKVSPGSAALRALCARSPRCQYSAGSWVRPAGHLAAR